MRFVHIALIILLSANQLKAVFVFDNYSLKAYESCLSLKFNQSKNFAAKAQLANPDNGILILIESYQDFLEAAITESPEKQKAFLTKHSLLLTRLDRLDQRSPWYYYIQSEILFQTSFFYLFNEDYLKGFMASNKAFRLLQKNQVLHPSFAPNLKMLGVTHVVIGSVPDEFAWALKLFKVKGSINLGMTELSKLFEKSLEKPEWSFLRNEALFYLTFCELQFRKEPLVLKHLSEYYSTTYFQTQLKTNPLLTYIYASLLIKTKKNDEAIALLSSRSFSPNTNNFSYLDFMTAECKLNRLDKDASLWFQLFLKNNSSKSYVKSAWQKLAWNALLKGDTANYHFYMERVLRTGILLTENDKQAHKEAASGEIPDIILLKARLLFDGCYYAAAAKILDGLIPEEHFQNPAAYVEYFYRLGRIYHESGEFNKAEKNYSIVLEKGKLLPEYFAANSALQLGLMYESLANNKRALEYFKLCLSIHPEEYKTGIHQKAKAGINRLSGE